MRVPTIALALCAAMNLLEKACAKAVFAHYMVGTVSEAHAHQDIDDAVAMGLDGFALNVGDPTKPFVRDTFNYMFDYARDTHSGKFWLFFSLDVYASGVDGKGVYPTDDFHDILRDFKGHGAYYKGPNGNSFISTFSDGGLTNIKWQAFRTEWANSLYFVPDFDNTTGYYDAAPEWWKYWGDVVDGVFSWEAAWPKRAGVGGAFPGDIGLDKTVLAGAQAHGKSYMMALSPLQYKDAYNTNLYRGGDLNLPVRMAAILSMSPTPDFIQVITWNDGPESHYIGNLWPEQNTDIQPRIYATQAAASHNAWQPLITSFINAFKAGVTSTAMQPPSGPAVGAMWYKTILQSTVCSNENLGGYDAKPDGFSSTKDQLNWAVVLPTSATGYSVRIYSGSQKIQEQNLVGGLNYRAADQGVQIGMQRMELLLNGNVVQTAKNGRCITNTCPDGTYNMNPQVVSLTSDIGDGFCPTYYPGNYPGGEFYSGGTHSACTETSGMEAADAWNKYGATDLLDEYVRSAQAGGYRLDAAIDAAVTKSLPSDSQSACSNIDTGVCGASDSCDDYDNKAFWYIQTAFGNLQIYLETMEKHIIDNTILSLLQSDAIVDMFSAPLKLVSNDNSKAIRILANVAGVFGMISPALGGIDKAMASGVTGVFGGLIGMVRTDMPTNDGHDFTTDAKKALTARLGQVFSAYLDAINNLASAIWVDKTGGNIPPWLLDPTTSPNGSPQTGPLNVTQFFQDGRFIPPLVDTTPIRDAIGLYTNQNLIGVVLASSDAYILVNAHPKSTCTFPGAAWLFNTCYSLEYPGKGGPAGPSDQTSDAYTRPLPPALISNMTAFSIYIPDVLDSAELCQIHAGFGGMNDPTQTMFLGDLPACFYAIPVIYVTPDGTAGSPWNASPCAVALGKQGTSPGHDELPSYLYSIFDRNFCTTGGRKRGVDNMGIDNPSGEFNRSAVRRASEDKQQERGWNYEDHIKRRKADYLKLSGQRR